MTRNPLVWIGLAGIEADDNPRAIAWQQRLHGLMIGVALMSLPAYLLDAEGSHPALHRIATILDGAICIAFLLETLWMVHISSFPGRYLVENWLNLVIIVGSAASAAGAMTEWVPLLRAARVAVGSLVLVRGLTEFHVLFTRRGAPLLVGAAACIMLAAGGMMYWVEPTVNTYWDGLWLAFVTGLTIGYGDVVPTSPAARVIAVFVAMIGVALMTLFTANLVAFFIDREDPEENRRAKEALRHDMAAALQEPLRAQAAHLEAELRSLREEIAALRGDVADLARSRPGDSAAGDRR